VESFLFTGTNVHTTPLATGSVTQADKCGGVSLSANGATNGILWVLDNSNSGTLRAFNPPLIPAELWDSEQNASRDALGAYTKFCAPTIANGKVYMATANKQLVVYGFFLPPSFAVSATPTSQSVNEGGMAATYAVTVAFSNAFANVVSLSLAGLPSGVSASFNPASFNASGTSTLTVMASNNVAQGAYSLTINGVAGTLTNSSAVTLAVGGPPSPFINTVAISGTNLVLMSTNGPRGGTWTLLSSTNLASPVTNWTPLATGVFDANGNLTLTNGLAPDLPQQFFLLQVP